MKVAAVLAGLAASAIAQPFVESVLDPNSTLADAQLHQNLRRQGNVIVTTGTTGTPRANRIEIRTMQTKQPQQFALLLLALQQWKGQSQTADDSYWGIAKIHGIPRQDWNGVRQCSTCNGPNVDGYCSHSVITFPMWHRAYLGLFEQQILKVAKSIADNAPNNRQQWQSVAAALRWPYFDWAAAPPGQGGSNLPPVMPTVVTDVTVDIDGPNGKETLFNPFYTFAFDDPSKNVYQYFTDFKYTLRYPTSNSPDAQSNEKAMIDTFNQQRTTIRDQLYTLLTGCDNYQHFATITGGGQGACFGSIEGLHDTVHNNFGSLGGNGITGGHMTYLPESSFDPVFWLHHCNVDRLIALWQAMHTDFSASQTTGDASWAVGAGTQIDMNFPLYPFRRDSNNFWTSNQLKDHRVFNADYPEFTNTDGSSGAIRQQVDRLYGPNANGHAGDITKREPQLPDVLGGVVKELTTSPTAAKNGSSFEYFANIVTPRYGGDGSYQVIAFHQGPSNEDPSTWGYDPNLVGAYGVFAAPGRTAMKAVAQGQIPLTTYLRNMTAQGQLKDLSEAEAVPFLKKNLRMRIQGWKGVSLKPEQLPGFKSEIQTSTRQPDENILKNLVAGVTNVFSEFITLPELTDCLFEGA